MDDIIGAQDFCLKWNRPIREALCNRCIEQCEISIADPDNPIAKQLIVDLELVKANRSRNNLDEDNDITYMKTEIEDGFKERADVIIDTLGLTHLKNIDKKKDKN